MSNKNFPDENHRPTVFDEQSNIALKIIKTSLTNKISRYIRNIRPRRKISGCRLTVPKTSIIWDSFRLGLRFMP
jgi:hypothetical protein